MPNAPITTFSGRKLEPAIFPESARMINVKLPASVTYLKGTVLGPVTASPGVAKAYVDAAVDGSGVARWLLVYDCTTDADGLISFGDASTGGEWGQKFQSCPVYYCGIFFLQDLVQAGAGAIDAAALADMQAQQIAGVDLTSGMIKF